MTLNSWRSFALRTTIGCAAVFATVRLALAREGVAGSAARSFVTIAGNITGASSPVRLTFTFRRADGTALCAPTVAGVALGAGGAFSAQVPIDAPCPATMFDGSNVQVDVAVNDTPIVGPDGGFAVNPVPYAHYASQYGTPDCPVGYGRVLDDATVRGGATVILCRRGRDQVVRVGSGASAFWIDRFEATVWSNREGEGTPIADDAIDRGVNRAGTWLADGGVVSTPTYFAVSVGDAAHSVLPATGMSWFQAAALCFASGKQLPTGIQWTQAAMGTPGDSGLCQVGAATALRGTELGLGCVSSYGAQDIIGNVQEWTDQWFSGVGSEGAFSGSNQYWVTGVPDGGAGNSGYGNARVYNSNTHVFSNGVEVNNLPAVVVRGGSFADPSNPGVLTMNLLHAPSSLATSVGFRCVIPR